MIFREENKCESSFPFPGVVQHYEIFVCSKLLGAVQGWQVPAEADIDLDGITGQGGKTGADLQNFIMTVLNGHNISLFGLHYFINLVNVFIG